MITLHKIDEEVKTILKWFAILSISLITILILFRIGQDLKNKFFPTPPKPPTVLFGKLPKVIFPKNTTDKNLSFSLNTITGKLPVFPDRLNVYKMVPPSPNLLSLKKAKERAAKMGFINEGFSISQTVHQWNQNSSSLIINLLSFNFNLSSNYFSQEETIKKSKLPNESQAVNKVITFLGNAYSFPEDIDLQKTKTTLLSIKNSKLEQATSFSNANAIRIDFFQKDIDNLPIFYPHPPKSLINTLLVADEERGKIAEVNYYHQNISDISSTYPIKTAEEAYSQIIEGKAYIASYFGGDEKIFIRNVFLGYYLEETEQKYLTPIIIFEGDNGFYAFVDAIKENWTSDQTLSK